MAPSLAVRYAARRLLAYVRREMVRGMSADTFCAERPARLHDELKFFLAVHDPAAVSGRRKRGRRG